MCSSIVKWQKVTRGSETVQECVERVLQSKTFRNAPSSRRLLKYLSDHAAAGDAAQLKEYTIGVDAFSKPPEYDPRVDSTVRIQIGRLRQKLSEYYRDEDKDTPVVLDLPKGGFSLICESRQSGPTVEFGEPARVAPLPANGWRMAAILFASVALAAIAILLYTRVRPEPAEGASTGWSPELAEFWGPFLNTSRPLLITVGNPLFLQFENKALYRDLSIEDPLELAKSPRLDAIAKALGGQERRPIHYYAAIGEVNAAFLLGQRLGPHQPNMSVVRSSQLQWQQLADANVLFLGPPRFFGEKLAGLPVALEIIQEATGFRVLHPQPGEPALFSFRDPPGFLAEDGEACILITHAAGPAGNTEVMTFAGNSTFGRAGAVDALTDPKFVKVLVARMRGRAAHIPPYFQVLLRVKYKAGVATETTTLLYREIHRRG